MLNLSRLAVPALLVSVLAAPANAALYSTTFAGTVSNQANTTFATGAAVTGAFLYNSDTAQFISFRIDGYSATQPFTSSVSVAPGAVINPFSAFYTAQYSPVTQTGSTNQTFTLDLEALTSFPTNSALAILTLPNLQSLLDTSLSQFTYYTGTGAGTGVTRLTASLTSVSTSVPEPASLALLAAPMIGLVLRRRR